MAGNEVGMGSCEIWERSNSELMSAQTSLCHLYAQASGCEGILFRVGLWSLALVSVAVRPPKPTSKSRRPRRHVPTAVPVRSPPAGPTRPGQCRLTGRRGEGNYRALLTIMDFHRAIYASHNSPAVQVCGSPHVSDLSLCLSVINCQCRP